MPKELQKNYDPSTSEERIYKAWEDNGCFKPSGDKTKDPYMSLTMYAFLSTSSLVVVLTVAVTTLYVVLRSSRA